MSLVSGYDLVIVDLDGVVYLGTEPVAGAPEAIGATVRAGIPVAYATNNASRSPVEVVALLGEIGVPAHPEEVVTSGRAAAELLATDLPAGSPVLVVGAPALREELREVGLRPVGEAAARPLAVVQGYGPAVCWADLAEACVAIRAGARWVATNTDPTLPSPRGPLPGNGSLVAALATALGGRSPDTVVGKPEPVLFEVAAKRRRAERVLVVGDRLDTDIEGAGRAGMASLLVLTGVSAPADLLRAGPHRRPTYVAADLGALSTPEAASLVPVWTDEAAVAGPWRVKRDGDRLVLSRTAQDGAGDAIAALRALACGAWAHPEWSGINADGPAAERALETLGLVRFAG